MEEFEKICLISIFMGILSILILVIEKYINKVERKREDYLKLFILVVIFNMIGIFIYTDLMKKGEDIMIGEPDF